MISLKKSFELQNYIRGLYSSTLLLLTNTNNVTTVTLKHYRSKAWAEGQDEETIEPKQDEYQGSVNEMIQFAEYLNNEIAKLTAVVNKAKGSEYDTLIAQNKTKRLFKDSLVKMYGIRPSSKMTQGVATKFNAEGNQVNYTYDIERVTSIDFDRNMVKAIISRLSKELDETSQTIDSMGLNTQVDYDGDFEIGERLEDAFDRWKDKATSANQNG